MKSYDPKDDAVILIPADRETVEQLKSELFENAVNHPSHYGGKDNPYEAIKVIEAWNLGFNLGNTVKYISRAGKKDAFLQDLKKAKWYLEREIQKFEKEISDEKV